LIVLLGLLLVVQLCLVILLELGLLSPFSKYVLEKTEFATVNEAFSVEDLGSLGKSTPTAVAKLPEQSLEEVPVDSSTVRYIEVVESCNESYVGECVRVRSAPSSTSSVVSKLRSGVVLKVGDEQKDFDGNTWYKISFDEWLRYPERLKGDWYISTAIVKEVYAAPIEEVAEGYATGTKKIVVDRSEQQLYAYDGDKLFLKATTSTGLLLTPTPRGTFHIFRKVPTRYMQGPLPYLADKEVYDLPGVPWNMYFTGLGAAIHGTYWHNEFGNPRSHGCVNLPPEEAKKLYGWADLGTTVIVQD
jgi:lipoprotein-anchoring transpeptidase ErfK/SrfK